MSTENKKLLWTCGHIVTVGNARMTINKTIKKVLFCYKEPCEQRTEIFILRIILYVLSTWVNWWVFMSNWAQQIFEQKVVVGNSKWKFEPILFDLANELDLGGIASLIEMKSLKVFLLRLILYCLQKIRNSCEHLDILSLLGMTKNKTIKKFLLCYNEPWEQMTEIFFIKNNTVLSTWVNGGFSRLSLFHLLKWKVKKDFCWIL